MEGGNIHLEHTTKENKHLEPYKKIDKMGEVLKKMMKSHYPTTIVSGVHFPQQV